MSRYLPHIQKVIREFKSSIRDRKTAYKNCDFDSLARTVFWELLQSYKPEKSKFISHLLGNFRYGIIGHLRQYPANAFHSTSYYQKKTGPDLFLRINEEKLNEKRKFRSQSPEEKYLAKVSIQEAIEKRFDTQMLTIEQVQVLTLKYLIKLMDREEWQILFTEEQLKKIDQILSDHIQAVQHHGKSVTNISSDFLTDQEIADVLGKSIKQEYSLRNGALVTLKKIMQEDKY